VRWKTFIIVGGKYKKDKTISTEFYQKRPGFVDDVTKTFGVFWVRSSNSCSLTKHER